MPRSMMCRVCRLPIPVGKGQVAYYHGECRKQRKHRKRPVMVKSAVVGRGPGSARARVDIYNEV